MKSFALRRSLRIALLAMLFGCFAVAAEPHPSLPAIGSLDGLGVNIHFTDPKPGELEMIAAAGFKWVRMDFHWSATEREKGKYDFSAYDRLAAALKKQKMRALFILDYGNKFYDDGAAPRSGEAREAFAKWAAAAVKHFAGRGFIWELWNEPNITSVLSTTNTTKAAYQAARTAFLIREVSSLQRSILIRSRSSFDIAHLANICVCD